MYREGYRQTSAVLQSVRESATVKLSESRLFASVRPVRVNFPTAVFSVRERGRERAPVPGARTVGTQLCGSMNRDSESCQNLLPGILRS